MEAQGTKEGRPAHKLFEHKVGEASPVRSTDGSAVPSEQVLERGIDIGPWTVRVRHGSIANASELDALSDQLDIPPPEMPFLQNALILEHTPSGFTYCFDAIRALQCVDGIRTSLQLTPIDCARECAAGMDIGSTGRHKRTLSRSGIKVAHAGAWGQSRYVYADDSCLDAKLWPRTANPRRTLVPPSNTTGPTHPHGPVCRALRPQQMCMQLRCPPTQRRCFNSALTMPAIGSLWSVLARLVASPFCFTMISCCTRMSWAITAQVC